MKLQTLLLAAMLYSQISFAQDLLEAPKALQKKHVNILHGDTTIDNYRWMHDKYNTDFINYLYAENAYADRKMKSTELLQKKIFEEYRKNMDEVFHTEPIKKDNYYYYTRGEKGKQYDLFCRKKDSLTAKEEIYLDMNKLAEEYLFAELQFQKVSPDHKLLAYAINTEGGDAGYLYIKNLETGEIFKDEIDKVASVEWTANNKTFYYLLEDKKTKKADKVYRHTIGDDVEKDTLIYKENDRLIWLNIGKTGNFLILNRGGLNGNETFYLNKNNPYGLFEKFAAYENEVNYHMVHYKQENYFYINTNWQAPNGRFMRAPTSATPKEDWEEIIPASDRIILENVIVKSDYYILLERKGGQSRIRVINRKNNESYIIKPDIDVYVQNISKAYDYDSCFFRHSYSSFMQNPIIKTHYLETKSDSLYVDTFAKAIPINTHNYITKRLWAPTEDGRKVPMDIIYKKGVKLNGKASVSMFAYGCYGSIEEPDFNPDLKTVLDRGIIFVLAHPRGEAIMGKYWHNEGKLLHKKNTFTDIIACCEYLIDNKYTSKKKIAIEGGSAGGLLVGSVVCLRPDIFGVGVANVPFVDVLNQMQDTVWPNIVGHFPEIGNPFKKQEYDTIKSYCPYQLTTQKSYPHLLVTSGYNDSRVPVWSPAKWVAKLRENKQDSTELLFKTHMSGGHGGGSGRYTYLKQRAFNLAFIMRCLGIKENYIELKGKLVDKDGSPIQFANIYLKGTTHGTNSNYDGEFLLEVKEGQPHEVIFQAVGFTTVSKTIDLNENTSELKVVMENEDQYIPQVIVTSDGKDPAYGIIKNAQKKRKFYLNQVKSYSTDIYMKGSDRLNEIPKKIPKFLKDQAPDSSDLGLLYLSESVARYHYQAPGDYKEEMFASKSAGTQRGFSWNRARNVLMNFYKNQVDLKYFSERDFISPIASSSNFYYKYKLIETFKDQGRSIHKIKVIPRRKSDPIFKGYIYIVDSLWNLSGINLTIGKESQIEWVDSLNFKQSFIPVTDSVFMPLSMEITEHIKVFKFGVTCKNVGFFSNYHINKKFEDKFFKREVFRVEKDADKKDSVFWEDTRPSLLTFEEEKAYKKSDSIQYIQGTKAYQDSVLHKHNKVTFGKVAILGYNHRNRFKGQNWGVNSALSMIDFNTVEGWSLNLEPYWSKNADSLVMPWFNKWETSSKIRYSIDNNLLYFKNRGSYTFDYIYYQKLHWDFGIMAEQYQDGAINPLLNTAYSLSYLENHAKFYEKTYAKFNYGVNLNTFFRINAGIEYAKRKALVNTTDFSFVDIDEKEYTSNNPLLPAIDLPAFKTHNSLTADLEVKFYFKRNYESYPDQRFYFNSNKPELTLRYKKGIAALGGGIDFDYAEFEIMDKISLRNFGTSHYKLKVGQFLNTDSMSFIDYKHFKGNQTIFLHNDMLSSFNALDYYDYSTNKSFFEAHYEHHFNGWIINKFPLLRKTKFQTLAGINFLYTEDKKDYTELFFGVENIFNMFRVDFVGKYSSDDTFRPEVRIGVDLDF